MSIDHTDYDEWDLSEDELHAEDELQFNEEDELLRQDNADRARDMNTYLQKGY